MTVVAEEETKRSDGRTWPNGNGLGSRVTGWGSRVECKVCGAIYNTAVQRKTEHAASFDFCHPEGLKIFWRRHQSDHGNIQALSQGEARLLDQGAPRDP